MTQTINGLTSILNDAETTYERGNAEIDKALEKFATGKAGLFHADGSAVYAGPVYESADKCAPMHKRLRRSFGEAEPRIGKTAPQWAKDGTVSTCLGRLHVVRPHFKDRLKPNHQKIVRAPIRLIRGG